MTRDDIRKLIGGYATGTLTESEQKLLFDAALEDQEIFDELAREQELKELIETPGVRDRLAAALAPVPEVRRELWWKRRWTWATAAGVAAAGFAIAVAVTQPPEPREVASVLPAQAQDKVSDAPPPAPQPAEPLSASRKVPESTNRARATGPAAPASEPPALRDRETEKAADTKPAAEPALEKKKEADQAPAAPAPPPAVSRDQFGRQQQTTSQRSAESQRPGEQQTPAALSEQRRDEAGQAGQLQPQAQAVGVDQAKEQQFRGQAANGAGQDARQSQEGLRVKELAQAAPPPPPKPLAAPKAVAKAAFAPAQPAFTYAITNGVLRLTPSVNGYLTMTATAPGQNIGVPQQQLSRGTPFEYAVPANAESMVLLFTLAPGGAGGAIESKPISGSVEFPANSPSIVMIRIPTR